MNASQERAINKFRIMLDKSITDTQAERYGRAVHGWEVEATSYGTYWVRAKVENLALPTSNALRYVTSEYWFLEIGKRGKITFYMYPDSLKQFAGKTYLGCHVAA